MVQADLSAAERDDLVKSHEYKTMYNHEKDTFFQKKPFISQHVKQLGFKFI